MPIYEIHCSCPMFFLHSAFLSGSKTARHEIHNPGQDENVFLKYLDDRDSYFRSCGGRSSLMVEQ